MPIRAYILFKVSSGTEREIAKKIAEFDEVLDVGIIYGEYDLIAKVSVQEMEHLNEFLEKIRSIPSIILTSTMIMAQEYKGKSKRPNA